VGGELEQNNMDGMEFILGLSSLLHDVEKFVKRDCLGDALQLALRVRHYRGVGAIT
jgi:hypothetical protein